MALRSEGGGGGGGFCDDRMKVFMYKTRDDGGRGEKMSRTTIHNIIYGRPPMQCLK